MSIHIDFLPNIFPNDIAQVRRPDARSASGPTGRIGNQDFALLVVSCGARQDGKQAFCPACGTVKGRAGWEIELSP